MTTTTRAPRRSIVALLDAEIARAHAQKSDPRNSLDIDQFWLHGRINGMQDARRIVLSLTEGA